MLHMQGTIKHTNTRKNEVLGALPSFNTAAAAAAAAAAVQTRIHRWSNTPPLQLGVASPASASDGVPPPAPPAAAASGDVM